MSVEINKYEIFDSSLESILPLKGKVVINTINAYSYIVAKKDKDFRRALLESDILLPDGEGIVMMAKKYRNQNINKIAGADLHAFLLRYASKKKLKCFYLGSSQDVLNKLDKKIKETYLNVKIETFSPPFKEIFSLSENREIIERINTFSPDILFVGMTAPKQEKWLNENKEYINFKYAGAIGAVFDFIAETKRRAPIWVIKLKMEWLHRAFSSWRLTKRYLYSNPLFLMEIVRLKSKK